MKIAILGTRGIPNRYGGFEQCAEKLALAWVKTGHEVTVYCPAEHPVKGSTWQGVRRRFIPSFEGRLGPWGTLLYDFLCLKDALSADFEVVLNLGYVPAGVFFPKRRPPLAFVTNMDGLEWKRRKWSWAKRRFARLCEARAAQRSAHLVADNPGIQEHLERTYGVHNITYIPYGAEIPPPPEPTFLREFGLSPYGFYLLIARLEPENNIATILEGYLRSGVREPFLVVGGLTTPYSRELVRRFARREGIRFCGAIYDYSKLSTLRHFARLYFHGHEVGGTNPSLLEAMAAGALIVAHDNVFNRYVLGEEGFYFSNPEEVARIIRYHDQRLRPLFAEKNLAKIKHHYRWDKVSQAYLALFKRLLN